MTPGVFRLRVKYRKVGRLRFLGHLEILRTIDRSIRRSGLPFAVTRGFSPHMRIDFCSALPVGVSSECEYFDVILTELVPAERALELLVASIPRDLAPSEAHYVDPSLPALEAELVRLRWEVVLTSPGLDADAFGAALASVAEKGTLEFLRSGKPRSVDLTYTLMSWDVSADEGRVRLTLDTRASQHGSLRPEILVSAALGSMPEMEGGTPLARTRRLAQWGERDGNLVEPA